MLLHNPKELWRFVKSNNNEQLEVPAILDGEQLITEDLDKATCFNKFFKSAFSVPFLCDAPLYSVDF